MTTPRFKVLSTRYETGGRRRLLIVYDKKREKAVAYCPTNQDAANVCGALSAIEGEALAVGGEMARIVLDELDCE